MTGSLKGRLFLLLLVTTGVVWLCATAWIYASTRAEVERVLDARLMEAARMVSSLVQSQDIDMDAAARIAAPARETERGPYERHLSCQIWSLSGSLLGRSDGAPAERLSDHADGFAEQVVDGETWRVFAVRDPTSGVEVLVGDNLEMRARLVRDIVTGLLLPMLLIAPLLAGIIWLAVWRGMRPLDRLAATLGEREADRLHPLPIEATVSEIRPVVAALNGLFERVAKVRDRERQFLAYAAHELRTPLSGLKTQAQIATRSDDVAVRAAALVQIVTAVDRTSRLVRQLLATAEAEAVSAEEDVSPVPLAPLLHDLLGDQHARLAAKGGNLVIDASVDRALVANQTLVCLALRNLVENAVSHSPQGGTVVLRRCGASILVEDEGPGIPADEIARATERFFRGRNHATVGSGLGLSIVKLCAEKLGGSVELANRARGGLAARLTIPGLHAGAASPREDA
ncbi:ATP-binding protein [Aurantimonas endophytica]|uniref:histidine kinase n=1 Tax=Aurantimonas endophytica TaxID=1522175 RepID=A0A7W6MN43_9HYPH|nr:ATP-binding protein [Aurantimonas endophytica]MBB4001545.1 two-component system sensor histidine kinase QseC [Aurantimonas endophytica]MCO6402815.1 two-component sensor histidine kinase [Aurantimonas endophytica]